MKIFFFLIIFFLQGCSEKEFNSNNENSNQASNEMLCLNDNSPVEPVSIPDIKKIILIIFENEDADTSTQMPFFSELRSKGSYLSQYHALFHPSQPNYFALAGGSSFDHFSNAPLNIEDKSLADLIESKGKKWKVYAENYPGNCFKGEMSGTAESPDLYARRHNPFISFSSIFNSPERCSNIVDSTSFFQSWQNNQLPDFSMYIPNNVHNGHDTGVAFADQWFKNTFGSFLGNELLMKDTLFIITFDEGRAADNQNKVYTLFLGPYVKTNFVSSKCYNHFSMLRTLEEIWGLGSLNKGDKAARVISDIWSLSR